jgi:phenylpropionate dioxygenase-like ring-hydroxylating dioxygenase large terminal subunit
VCPFHAWSYHIDGSIANIPSADGFSGLDLSTLGLVRLPTKERHGLVWVALTPGIDFDVASYLGPDLDEELGSWELNNLISERMGVATEDANWKLLVNGFLEGYHVGKLHPKSVAPYIRQNMGPFKPFGRHCRLANVRYRYKGQGKPLDAKFLYGVTGMYVLHPNTIVIWHGTHFERYSMFPVPGDPGRSVCHVNLLVRPEAHADKAKWDENWKLVHGTIFGEDFAMARVAQAGFSAGILDHLILGRNEPCVQHFHQQLVAALSEA